MMYTTDVIRRFSFTLFIKADQDFRGYDVVAGAASGKYLFFRFTTGCCILKSTYYDLVDAYYYLTGAYYELLRAYYDFLERTMI